jgi:2-oxoisovalerate dehydrogenase E1 component
MHQEHAQTTDWLPLFRAMIIAREIDRAEEELVRQGHACFQVSGTGHEATAALAFHLTERDWLHLHYRDKALLLARGIPIKEFFLSLLCRAGSHSDGRQMSAHFSSRQLNVMSMVGPVGNNALQAVGVGLAIKDDEGQPIVVCSVGDGTTQEGEFLEAVAEAHREGSPVLFLVEDNGWAISTRTTGKTFFAGLKDDELFLGAPITFVEGTTIPPAAVNFGSVVQSIRERRSPAIVVCRMERLCDHTNADDQGQYRGAVEVARLVDRDPVALFEQFIIAEGLAEGKIRALRCEVAEEVRQAAAAALAAPEPQPEFEAKRPLPPNCFHTNGKANSGELPSITMRGAVNAVLRHRLDSDARVILIGQDIEDPKGDVFGVTRGLSTDFPGRVRNAALSESTIIGTSIGRALAGQRPVAFIQFADFLPLAYNQIASELGSIYWRTCGQWECPVIVMVACGGYRPGLGPFHSQTLESIVAHVPGVDVLMPSSAADAAGLLNAAFESGRPTLFFYPKALLNSLDVATRIEPQSHSTLLGEATFLRRGDDLTVVTWGAATQECQRAVDVLEQAVVGVDLIDLRTISPWDRDLVLQSAFRSRRLLIVHEDNATCGFGAEVAAAVAESADEHIEIRRVVRPDVYIPCHFPSQRAVLPSWERILSAAAELLKLHLTWAPVVQDVNSLVPIITIGSGPADDQVEILDLRITVGESIKSGQVVAEIEAAKSVVDLVADIDGVVVEILARKGDRVRVGSILAKIAPADDTERRPGALPSRRPLLQRKQSNNGRAAIKGPNMHNAIQKPVSILDADRHSRPKPRTVFLGRPAVALGSRVIHAVETAATVAGWSAAEAISLTGVESRRWVNSDDDVVSLAIRAAQALVASLDGSQPKITCVICSTTSPCEATPSIACRVGGAIAESGLLADDCHAFDINAACSGFLFGVRSASDYLHGNGAGAVLLLTAEVLSSGANPQDFNTAFLFGDAATATLIGLAPHGDDSLSVTRPLLRSKPDAQRSLRSPCMGSGYITMDGMTVAREANKAMSAILAEAAAEHGLTPQELAYVIPHPGSKRILQSVSRRLEIDESKVLHTLADTGNTSSSSIPLALDRYWSDLRQDESIGLAAFGAGFTAAAAIAYKRVNEKGSAA